MKRFVIFLPLVVISSFKAADDLINIPLSSLQLTSAQPTSTQQANTSNELVCFKNADFFEKLGHEMDQNFLKWSRGEECILKNDLGKEIKKYPSILPMVEIRGYEDVVLAEAVKGVHKKYVLSPNIKSVESDFSQHSKFKKFLEKVKATIDSDGQVCLEIGRPDGNTVGYSKKKESVVGRKAQSLLIDYSRACLWVGMDNGSILPLDLASGKYKDSKVFCSQSAAIKALGLLDQGRVLISLSDDKLCFSDVKSITCRAYIDTQKYPYNKIYASERNLVFSHAIKANYLGGRFTDGDLCFEAPLSYIKNKVFDTKNGAFFVYGLYLTSINKKFEDIVNTEKKDDEPLTAAEVLNQLYNSNELHAYGEKTVQPVLKSMIEAKAKDYKVELRNII